MLVIDGKLHPASTPTARSRYVRNGVGIAPDGTPLFVITTDVVSFGKFARFFRDRLKAATRSTSTARSARCGIPPTAGWTTSSRSAR